MNRTAEREAMIRWLTQPTTYPHLPATVDHIETHISDVFLAGDYAFKLKKPVHYDFLDFSTIEAREHACREEVRINRRLAPDTYLSVVPVVRSPRGDFQLGGVGPVVDWVVKMQRLPTALTLDELHRRGQLLPRHIDRLAQTLVGFYQTLKPLPLAAPEYCERCRSHVYGNWKELLAVQHHLPRTAVERIHGFQLQLLRLQPTLFEERVRSGHLVDGHGDLRPEHICLTEPIAIFDCIEFNADFRHVDVADELAFLAAECDFIGADWVGPQLLQGYQELSGDTPPPILVDFYKSYRACVRGKVAALRADQLTGDAKAVALEQARQHLSWADRYAAAWLRPLVLVVGGLAGTGKSTLAAALGEALGAQVLRTDVLRRELFGAGPHPTVADGGIYSVEARERTYDLMFHRAAALHSERISVVLDGTFSTVDALQRAQHLAADPRSVFLAIECVCPSETAHARIGARLAEGRDVSDARPDIHDLQQARWRPWPADVPQRRIDTQQPLAAQVAQVIAALSARNMPTMTPGA